MPYTVPTFGQAKNELASRLNDPGKVRWVDAELGTYILESLRVWSAWTAHWRDTGSLTTVVDQAFYELPTELPTLRQQTVTNWDLVTDLQYTLLEPAAPGGTWTGTDQFTLAQLTTAIQRRRDQFLRETGAVQTRSVTAYVTTSSGRIVLSEDVLIVRRAAWRVDSTMTLIPLRRTDEWATNHFVPGWPQGSQQPGKYSVSATPPLELQLIPPMLEDGSLDLVSVNKGATVDSATDATLGVPNDFAWVIKYGALADLLQGDGLALDPARAAYCESRWAQGIAAATTAPVVIAGRINGVTCRIGSLADADAYSPTWQLVSGTPRQLILAGQNLLGVWPPPGVTGGPWTLALDVVRNAPVPTLDADILQISADIYDSILDYAQHVALAKEGPGELEMATALLERVTKAAGVDLALQQASQPSRMPLLDQTQQDVHTSARLLDPVEIR